MSKNEKYQAKLEILREKLRTLINSGDAKLHSNILQLLKITESPKAVILKHILDPKLKLMDLNRLLYDLCPHFYPRIQKDESGACSYCNSYVGGWWCPNSPDNSCYYYSEVRSGKSFIQLADGTIVELSENHDHNYESEDSCLFCHQPDERK